MNFSSNAILRQYDDKGTYLPDKDRGLNAPFRGEVSTMWLGVENPGMNVALYIPGYHERPRPDDPYNPSMMCFHPHGRIEIEALPELAPTPPSVEGPSVEGGKS